MFKSKKNKTCVNKLLIKIYFQTHIYHFTFGTKTNLNETSY